MNYFLSLLSVCFLLASAEAASFIPNDDLVYYGSDGELIAMWGEHNFYTDTSTFGRVMIYEDGMFKIGGMRARNT